MNQLIDKTESCWNWIGTKNPDGYGKYRGRHAHRVVYERDRGAIPEGLELDHLCRNKQCVNPDHLEPVTRAENIDRRTAVTFQCPSGHSYSEANTYVRPDGTRRCRECVNARAREYRARKRP
ncbi:HNH endonuclease signature motif containing protein [Curtobacterium sp. Csp1]|uniref:HNH endonuclease signature motif containing protein n=1 Tax=Curtobacterium sp. Csp1 TaxID=2495429 RepID=UPI001C2EB30E|nr:HNH endonuclease signature motif containing protein [Curtobacterium sp. Csp1]